MLTDVAIICLQLLHGSENKLQLLPVCLSLFQILSTSVDWTDSCAQWTPRTGRPRTQNTQKLQRKVPLLQQFPYFYSLAPKLPRLALISYAANTTHAINTSTGLHTTKPAQGPLISVKGFSKLPFSFSRLHPQKQYYNLHLIYWFMQFPFLHNFRTTSSLSSHRFLYLKLQVTFDLIWILHSTHQARLHRS